MIFILTGEVNSGKTTLLKKLVGELEKRNLRVEGFLSEAIWRNDEKIGYNFLDLRSRASVPFIRRSGQKDWERIGPYFFIPESLVRVKGLILSSQEADVVVIDEVGPLELSGRGIWPALSEGLFQRGQSFLLVARRSVCQNLISVLGEIEVQVFGMEEKNIFSRLLEAIVA